MSRDEVEMKIIKAQQVIATQERIKGRINGNSLLSKGAKDTKLQPVVELIRDKKWELDELLRLKDKLTPFHERLDPESTFYKHYMQKTNTDKLKEITYQ